MNNGAMGSEKVAAGMICQGGAAAAAAGGGKFFVECVRDGKVVWESEWSPNMVVNVGLQDMVSKYFLGGSSAPWFIGLYGAAGLNNPAAGDTMGAHPGWTEFTDYVGLVRPAVTFGAATLASPSVITNAGSPAVFEINGSGGIVGGAFLVNENTKGGVAGLLFSAADFQAPGDRVTISGDVINVTYRFEQNTL